jgi:hypothetical protein
MPNWSYNNLTITGNPEKMKDFYDVALKPNINGDITFNFANIFPMPEKVKNTIAPSGSAKGKKWINADTAKIRDVNLSEMLGSEIEVNLIACENNTDEKCEALKKEYGADNWYDWNIITYGTKWDIDASDFVKGDDEFNVYFDTAWSPPGNFLNNLQKKFPDLDIRLSYSLEGSDDCGVLYTDRFDKEVSLVHEEDEIIYRGSDGRDIYFNNDDGEWHYHDDDEICEDYISINPFD